MSKLVWDATGERYFETGLRKGVFYPLTDNGSYTPGEAWNGLTALNSTPGGAEPTDLWADDMKYATLRSAETYGATVEAYTYPDGFAACDGSAEPIPGVKLGQQGRKAFGMSYVTSKGNDTDPEASGYIIHLIYNATASPSERNYQTKNDSPEAITMSWELSTTPVAVDGYKPVATIDIDSTKLDAETLKALEDKLYGTESEAATLPLPADVIALLKGTAA